MKNKKLLIILSSFVLIAGIIMIILLNKEEPKKENPESRPEETIPEIKDNIIEEIDTIQLKENLTFEINSEVNLFSLINENNKVEIISKNETIDTKVLGEKEIIIKYKENEEEKEFKFKINIVDTTSPNIEFESNLFTIQGKKIDLLKDVKVTDNSNEKIKVTVAGNYDFNKLGEYKLKYIATDSSGNKKEEEFILIVKAKNSSNNNESTNDKQENNSNVNNNESNNNQTTNNNQNATNNNQSTNNNTNNNSNTNAETKPSTDSNPSNDSNNNIEEQPKQEDNIETQERTTEYRQQQAKKMITLINQARKENGLKELKLNTSLESSAKIRAKELVTKYSHTRPNGKEPYSAITIDYYSAGENIAAGHTSIEQVFEGWMNSPGHRANILSDKYTDIGICWYYDSESEYKNHWVQLFAGIEEEKKEYRQTEARNLVTLINQARKNKGLNELKINTSLENSAKIRAKELVTNYSMNRPDGSEFYTAITVGYNTIYQNMAAGYEKSQAVFNLIEESNGSRNIMLDSSNTDIGISLYYDSKSKYKYYWVIIIADI